MNAGTAPDPNVRPAVSIPDEISQVGYCLRDAVGSDVVDRALARFAELGIELDRPVYRSFVEEPRDVARAVDLDLKALFAPAMQQLLPDHEVIVGTFIFKGAHGPSIDFHQDWTFTDERRDLSVLFWIPLVDVDTESGTLAVIPGSHLWTTNIRTSSKVREGPTVPHQEAMAAAAVPVSLSAGQAVAYTPAILHGSGPNLTECGRPAVVLITVPKGSQIVHFIEDESETVGYVVDESHFTTEEFESAPRNAPGVEPWAPAVVASDFVEPLSAVLPALGEAEVATIEPSVLTFPAPVRSPIRSLIDRLIGVWRRGSGV